jgi:bifunctional non-homologous end joining protein LigD
MPRKKRVEPRKKAVKAVPKAPLPRKTRTQGFRKRRTQAKTAGKVRTAGSKAPKSLAEYQAMRDFVATPEPSGSERVRRRRQPSFTVQLHLATARHYDFRLELEGVLKSWSVPKGPSYDPKVKRLAMATEDHPLSYGDFEGVIPKGHYGAGPVMLWDTGTVTYLPDDKSGEEDPSVNLRRGVLKFRLAGKKLAGEWALVKTAFGGRGNAWLLIKHRDATADPARDVVVEKPLSVKTRRSIERIRKDGGA